MVRRSVEKSAKMEPKSTQDLTAPTLSLMEVMEEAGTRDNRLLLLASMQFNSELLTCWKVCHDLWCSLDRKCFNDRVRGVCFCFVVRRLVRFPIRVWIGKDRGCQYGQRRWKGTVQWWPHTLWWQFSSGGGCGVGGGRSVARALRARPLSGVFKVGLLVSWREQG